MDRLPENIANKIYKDVHEMGFYKVMDQMVDNKMIKLADHRTSVLSYDENNKTMRGALKFERYWFNFFVIESRKPHFKDPYDHRNLMNLIQSYDLFDFTFKDIFRKRLRIRMNSSIDDTDSESDSNWDSDYGY
jgi:hypothetical protein